MAERSRVSLSMAVLIAPVERGSNRLRVAVSFYGVRCFLSLIITQKTQGLKNWMLKYPYILSDLGCECVLYIERAYLKFLEV